MNSDASSSRMKSITFGAIGLLLIAFIYVQYFQDDTLTNTGAVSAKIVQIKGDVQWLVGAGGKRIKAVLGDLINMGDSIKTSAGSSLTLVFADQSKLLVSEDTYLTLESMMQSNNTKEVETTINLNAGSIESRVTKKKTFKPRYRVVTPALQLAVRGTVFDVSVDKNTGTTSSRVIKGVVNASAAGKEIELLAGFGTVAQVGKQPDDAIALLDAPVMIILEDDAKHYLPLKLSWKPLKNIEGYHMQLLTGPSYDRLIHDKIYRVNEVTLLSLPDANYKMRVRGISANGLEGMDGEQTFVLDAHPLPPKVISPINAQIIKRKKSKFYWQTSSEAMTYHFQVSDNEDFSNIIRQVDNLKSGMRGISIKLPNGEYYWRIASMNDADGKGPFSKPQKFTVDRNK